MHCNEKSQSVIHNMLVADCESLFHHYGCDIVFHSEINEPVESAAIGVIDAGCDEVELSLALHIPFSILALSYPCQEAVMDLSEEQLEDWLLELANQLMGKIKNRLVNQGLSVKLGLPEGFFDVGENAVDAFCSNHARFVFEVDNQIMECWLHVDFKVDVPDLIELAEEDAFNGDIELF